MGTVIASALTNGTIGVASGSTLTTGSITTVEPCYILVFVESYIVFGSPNTPTVSGGSLVYNNLRTDGWSLTGKNTVWWAFVPVGTGAFTITASFAGQNQSSGIVITAVQLTGTAALSLGISPVRASFVNSGNGGAAATATATLTSQVARNSTVEISASAGSGVVTSEAGWIDIYTSTSGDISWRANNDPNNRARYALPNADWIIQAVEINGMDDSAFTYVAPVSRLSGPMSLRMRSKHMPLQYNTGGAQFISQVFSGTLTMAGAVKYSVSKILAGTLTTAGALIRKVFKTFTGTLTTSGALTPVRVVVLVLAGTLTTAGTLIRKPLKIMAGTLTTSGAVKYIVSKILAGTLTTSGTLAALKTKLLAMAGTLTTSGALVRKPLLTFTGTLATAGALFKAATKVCAGTLTTSGGLIKLVGKTFAGILTTAGDLITGLSAFRSAARFILKENDEDLLTDNRRIFTAKERLLRTSRRLLYGKGRLE